MSSLSGVCSPLPLRAIAHHSPRQSMNIPGAPEHIQSEGEWSSRGWGGGGAGCRSFGTRVTATTECTMLTSYVQLTVYPWTSRRSTSELRAGPQEVAQHETAEEAAAERGHDCAVQQRHRAVVRALGLAADGAGDDGVEELVREETCAGARFDRDADCVSRRAPRGRGGAAPRRAARPRGRVSGAAHVPARRGRTRASSPRTRARR